MERETQFDAEVLKEFADIDARIDNEVTDKGYTLYACMADGVKGFVTTIGRFFSSFKKYDGVEHLYALDFLVIGIDIKTSYDIISATLEEQADLRTGVVFGLTKYPGRRFQIVEVDFDDDAEAIYYLAPLAKFQKRKNFDAGVYFRQLVVSDSNGKFRGEEGCNDDEVAFQYPASRRAI